MSNVTLFLYLTALGVFQKPDFQKQSVLAVLDHDDLLEASGLDASLQNKEHFWSHNDSGGDPAVYLIDRKGKVKLKVLLEGIKNRDWEELVSVQHDDGAYLYIAEIGDNRGRYRDVSLLRIREPLLKADNQFVIPSEEIEQMTFTYEDGPRDAEAIFYDYATEEFVLITKREEEAMVYTFRFESGGSKEILSRGKVPDRNFTAADCNQKGEILVKTYDKIYFWNASSLSAAERILDWEPQLLTYKPEPQGEAICWLDGDIYTISEKVRGFEQELLLFERTE